MPLGHLALADLADGLSLFVVACLGLNDELVKLVYAQVFVILFGHVALLARDGFRLGLWLGIGSGFGLWLGIGHLVHVLLLL